MKKDVSSKFKPMINYVDHPDQFEIKYIEGHPREYRFNASTGTISVSRKDITKKGESFTIVPIAYRVFTDNIMGYGLRDWVELFFINNDSTICSILLHGYSVQNLMVMNTEMIYDGLKLCDVKLTITPREKTNTAKQSKYFVAEFDYEELDLVHKNAIESYMPEFPIWNKRTLTGAAELTLSDNYTPPITKELEEAEVLEELEVAA